MRTFTHYETRYFSKWYYEQSKEVQAQVKKLVEIGALEFVNGGHEMHDEACPTYQDMLLNI